MTRFNADEAHAKLHAHVTRRATTRAQIRADQASGAKRDETALEAERQWYERQAKKRTTK